jgi:hypothetical protein
MNSHARSPRRTVVPFVAAAALLSLPAAANAADVAPVSIPGNPTCLELGYTHELKFDPPAAGTDSADGVTIEMTRDEVSDPLGTLVGWSSSAPIDAVIVKGGPNANAYVYPAESTGDEGLHTPLNGDTYYGLSHVTFCWDDETPDTPDTPDTPPADQPPADQPPVPQPPVVQPPAAGGVLPETVQAGASKLTGPSGCAGRTVTASVKGTEIAKVVFRLDGRKVKTTAGAGAYSIKTSKLGIGVHRIKAKVTYSAASGTRARTHVVTFQRCAAKKIAPRFAG